MALRPEIKTTGHRKTLLCCGSDRGAHPRATAEMKGRERRVRALPDHVAGAVTAAVAMGGRSDDEAESRETCCLALSAPCDWERKRTLLAPTGAISFFARWLSSKKLRRHANRRERLRRRSIMLGIMIAKTTGAPEKNRTRTTDVARRSQRRRQIAIL